MAGEVKRRAGEHGKVVIHKRRFWRRYPDGRMERIYINERIKNTLWSLKATTPRSNEEGE